MCSAGGIAQYGGEVRSRGIVVVVEMYAFTEGAFLQPFTKCGAGSAAREVVQFEAGPARVQRLGHGEYGCDAYAACQQYAMIFGLCGMQRKQVARRAHPQAHAWLHLIVHIVRAASRSGVTQYCDLVAVCRARCAAKGILPDEITGMDIDLRARF